MSYSALSDSFEYLCDGSTIIEIYFYSYSEWYFILSFTIYIASIWYIIYMTGGKK